MANGAASQGTPQQDAVVADGQSDDTQDVRTADAVSPSDDPDESSGSVPEAVPTESDSGSADDAEAAAVQSGNDEGQPVAAQASGSGVYEVSDQDELDAALAQMANDPSSDITLVLKGGKCYIAPTESYVSTFGIAGKRITVTSEGDGQATLAFFNRGMLEGPCTFDNVKITCGGAFYCNGFSTEFTKNSTIDINLTLYGGGYETTVASTHVVIAGTGSINPGSGAGRHDIIGGSYKGSVEGDTYLEITGSIAMAGGNHLNPGCVMGDGTSGDAAGADDVYVGGNATLVYDNSNASATPAIEGTYGCEMRGNVTLDVRSGRANEICGTQEFPDKSIIRGDLHIIAGSEKYENTDRTLRLNSNWPIIGAGCSIPEGTYEVGGNITIDAYENVWGWDKGASGAPSNTPYIEGAKSAKVGGSIVLNVNGTHVGSLYGAERSTIQGELAINATDVDLEDPDTGYILCKNDTGYYDEGSSVTLAGKATINMDGGRASFVSLTSQDSDVAKGSAINVTGKPEIATGICGVNASLPKGAAGPIVNLSGVEATIPYVKFAAQANITGCSQLTIGTLSSVDNVYIGGSSVVNVPEKFGCNNSLSWKDSEQHGLEVEAGSSLTTDGKQAYVYGYARIDGTWEQNYSAAEDYFDVYVAGATTVGSKGRFIDHGTCSLKGTVTNNGTMALMNPAFFQGDYIANGAEVRIPAIVKNYDGTDEGGDIPLIVAGNSTGQTTVNTVDQSDWQTLKTPAFGDNYVLSKADGDKPEQSTFVLGNQDATQAGYYLKRVKDADGNNDYHMWQVAKQATLTFDDNGANIDSYPVVESKDLGEGETTTFECPVPTRSGWTFTGWNTQADGKGTAFTSDTEVSQSQTVYAQWVPDAQYDATIVPADITIYAGGQGYSGVIGADGEFASNDLPELGARIVLPDDINDLLGNKEGEERDLSSIVTLKYNDPSTGTTRSWSLELYGSEGQSHMYINGRRVYVYRVMPSKIDGGSDTVPFRMQFTDADGNVMTDSGFLATDSDQYRDYATSFYYGSLNPDYLSVSVDVDGKTVTRPLKLGTGKLRVRGNNDETYTPISSEVPTVDRQNLGAILAGVAQEGTEYFINEGGVSADPTGVRLMVDSTLDDGLLTAYLDSKEIDKNRYSYGFKYLDLVDTHNGNAYVRMGEGQRLNVFWPVPSDAADDSDFRIVHFKGLDRNSNEDPNEMLKTHIPEELTGEVVTIEGQRYVKFTVDSFSPFALLYEKKGASVKPSDSTGSGNGSDESNGESSTTKPSGSAEKMDDMSSSLGTAEGGSTEELAGRQPEDKGEKLADTGDRSTSAVPIAALGIALVAVGVFAARRDRSGRKDE